MADLEERFDVLSRVEAPDLWAEIGDRLPGPMPRPPIGPRVVAAAVALLIAAAGFAGAAAVLRPDPNVDRTGGVSNGAIAVSLGPDQDVVLLDPQTGASTQLVERHAGGQEASLAMAWSPDGSRLAFTDRREDGSVGVFVLEVASGDRVHVSGGLSDGDDPAWSPDGTRIAFTGFGGELGYEVYVVRADGTDLHPVTRKPDDGVSGAFMPAWSPVGTRIAFALARFDRASEAETSGIAVVDLTTGEETAVTTSEAVDESPAWSPDGSRIAFLRKDDGVTRVYVADTHGGEGREVAVGDGLDATSPPDWSSDGPLVFGSFDPSTSNVGIAVADADGTNARTILEDAYAASPIWSPDGGLIAFVGDDAGRPLPAVAIRVIMPDGSAPRTVAALEEVSDIAWRPRAAEPSPQPSPYVTEPEPPPIPSSAELVDTFRVGTDVRSVAYGEGSVWVAASNDDGTFAGRIVRVDPETHEVQAEIPVDVIPTWEVGGGAMVVVDGSLWVTGGLDRPGAFNASGGGADAAVIRIDAASNQVVQTFALGGRIGADLTFMDGQLWVLLFGDESVDNSMEVVRVDPATGDVLARIPLTANWAHTIVAADGHLVVYEGGEESVNVGGHLTSIDPARDALVPAEIPSRYSEGGPVLWRGQVWAATEEGFARFDPLASEILEGAQELDPSRFAFCCGFVEADDRGIWFLGYDGTTGGTERRLDLFDPATGEVTELAAFDEGNPVAMAMAPDGVWILNYEGTLTHVELR
jgi:Tol biopolymer transport system component